ncbi:MAG TPA: hypothetical protein VEC35_21395 [Noviherbaspirillum sp.]|nr:hypothetical protein [Noviherbaspirillum sp.]
MKTFFIWLLLSFIPLQGIAANAVLVCKAAHQAPVPSQAMDDIHAHPCGGIDTSSHALDGPDGSDDNGQEDNADCAAHYISASWLHTAEMTVSPAAPLPVTVSYLAFHLPSFVPDGPERPPRGHSL